MRLCNFEDRALDENITRRTVVRVACNESDWQRFGANRVWISSYTKYGELSQQRIKYEILNNGISLSNTLE